MKIIRIFFTVVLMLCVSLTYAQRKQMLGRGVVATRNSGTGVMVSWRRLIQDPEDARYNVYVAKGGGDNYTKINAKPTNLTNLTTSESVITNGSKIRVTLVDDSGNEGEPSVPFTYRTLSLNGVSINNSYLAVNYKSAGSPIYNTSDRSYTTKFCWPVDIDGDGEMEYIVDRNASGRDMNGYTGNYGDCLEAYDRDGKHLWTVDLGPNIWLSRGQNDCVTVGDFDGDGKGDVMVEASDGTRLWDKSADTWGKYIAYGKNDGSSADTDGDGIVNYSSYAAGKNPQYYMLVIDGMTGEQKDIVPMTLPSDNTGMKYTRTNKSAFMNDEYPWMMGAMGTAYLDGVNQSAVIQFQLRTNDGSHHYFTYAYGYEGGEFKEKWIFRFHDNGNPSEFHHIRIGDVDGDGKDEIMNGACAIDDDGTLLWNSRISHGDRFRLSDINPDRPGQEVFAIQQNAGDMLGQILYDARNGEAIKKWYLSSVGDVGRGECMDVDPAHKGYEMWSTMANIYNAQGDAIGSAKPYPYEGVWWDGDLGRETVMTSGSGNNCPIIIAKYNGTDTWNRLNQISRDANWAVCAENAVRPMFWGDIYGDWREELVLKQTIGGEECGFVAFTTNYATTIDNIYCLLQDPNYLGQTTNRGYYQSPNTSFYLGYDMPRPQLPPFIQADADNEVFDLTLGNAVITPSPAAKNIYAMPVKGQTLTCEGMDGTANLWKSQQGRLILNGDVNTEGNTIVSEGVLEVNGKIKGNVDLRARGVLTGCGTIGSLTLEGSLNYAEGVIRPNGVLTISSSFIIDRNTFIEIDTDSKAVLHVDGDLTVKDDVTFIIDSKNLSEGEYRLIEYTGVFAGKMERFLTRGISGLSYNIIEKDNAIILKVNGQREKAEGVKWTGSTSQLWDYQTENWMLDGAATTFVAGDEIVFDDTTDKTTVKIDQLIPTGGVEVNSTQRYTFTGNGGLSGEGSLTKNGTGTLTLAANKSDYTGATIINEGTVVVKDLADGGQPSSIGAASASSANLQIGNATLTVENTNAATNRAMTLTDTATVNIPSGTTAFKGNITGKGVLRKTGNGQLNITYSAATTYTGGTILHAGTLAQGTWKATFGAATSPLHVTGNATIVQFDVNSSSTMPDFQNALTIDAGKTLTFKASSRGNVRGKLLGAGTFAISFPYVRGDVSTNVSAFEGTYDVLTANCRFVQSMDFSKATLKLESGAYAAGFKAGSGTEVSYTHKIGSLSGQGTLGTGTWNVGYLGKNDTFAGTFNSAAVVNKYGDGALVLTGTSESNITINAGAVFANNTSASVTKGTITVKSGGLLTGQGQVQNVTVNSGGAIGAQMSPTSATLVKALTINGTLKVNLGQINVRYRSSDTKTTFDTFKQQGTATLVSPTICFSSINDTEILPDTEFRIFTGKGAITLSGEVTILPASPCAGYEWDASTLATDGTIRIVASTGIDHVDADDVHSDLIYDIKGNKIERINASGLYIIDNQKIYIRK